MSAANSALQHATAPGGNITAEAISLNLPSARIAADAAKFDVDDPASSEVDGGLGTAQVVNGFVEAKRSFYVLL